jgi:hypothetical protein
MSDAPQPEPQEPHSTVKGRVVGLVLLLLGLGLSAGCVVMAKNMTGYLFFGAWLGPFCTCLGLAALIEGPKIPVENMSTLMKAAAGVGTLAGFALLGVIEFAL